MKFNYRFSFLVLVIFPIFLHAQNLVPDSSFEKTIRLPKKKINSIACTKDWLCPMDYGVADYYHVKGKGHGSAPRNIFGRQRPHSGNAYGGICIRKKFIEYVETKLTDTLIKNQEYLVEFYISRAELSFGAVKEFGVLFTDKIAMGISGIGIPQEPSVELIAKHGFRRKWKWMKFSAIYRAKGGEGVLILGYFNHKNVKRFKGNSHYYVDDVSVRLIPKKTNNATSVSFEEEVTVPKAYVPNYNESNVLEDIYFVETRNELLPKSFPALDKLVSILKKLPEAKIEISAYHANAESEEQNQLVSELRARAVAYYLISKGIHPARINYTGYGNSNALANNNTVEGKQKNSRVEFSVRK